MPSRAVASDLLVKGVVRQDAFSDIRSVPRKLVESTAIEESVWIRSAWRARPSASIRRTRERTKALRSMGGSRPLQMLGRAIDASGCCGLRRAAREERSLPRRSSLGPASSARDASSSTRWTHPSTPSMTSLPLVHLIAAMPFVEHAADDAARSRSRGVGRMMAIGPGDGAINSPRS
jgi:hypothetical protein